MILTRIFPPGDAPVDLEAVDAQDTLHELYRPPRAEWVRLNLIGSVSGSAGGTDGTSETLSNPLDRRILKIIRDHGDVVLVGAASVRVEGYYLPRTAALAVVTSSGDMSAHRITTTGQRGPLLILCPASAVDRVRSTLGEASARIIEVPDTAGHLAPADIIDALRDAGFHSVVVEGGPSLAGQLIDAGLVDELCLSTSPKLGGTAIPLFGTQEMAERQLTLTQILADEFSGLYARWAVTNAAEPAGHPASGQ